MSGRLGREVYATERWKRLRLLILDAAGWKCAECGTFADEVHHVVKLADNGSAFDRENLRPLCRFCHLQSHRESSNNLTDRQIDRRNWRKYLGET